MANKLNLINELKYFIGGFAIIYLLESWSRNWSFSLAIAVSIFWKVALISLIRTIFIALKK